MPQPTRYWLRPSPYQFIYSAGDAWTEVPEHLFIAAERAEGFTAPPGKVSTAGFTGQCFAGTTLLTDGEAGLDLRHELDITRRNLHAAVTELTHLKRDLGIDLP